MSIAIPLVIVSIIVVINGQTSPLYPFGHPTYPMATYPVTQHPLGLGTMNNLFTHPMNVFNRIHSPYGMTTPFLRPENHDYTRVVDGNLEYIVMRPKPDNQGLNGVFVSSGWPVTGTTGQTTPAVGQPVTTPQVVQTTPVVAQPIGTVVSQQPTVMTQAPLAPTTPAVVQSVPVQTVQTEATPMVPVQSAATPMVTQAVPATGETVIPVVQQSNPVVVRRRRQAGTPIVPVSERKQLVIDALNLVEKAGIKNCVGRVICELTCDPSGFGVEGRKAIQNMFKIESMGILEVDPKFKFYKEASINGTRSKASGKKCGDTCGTAYSGCDCETKDLVSVSSLFKF